MQGNGTHNQPIGTWSDDSSMVIATMDSLIENKGINYNDMMDKFLSWFLNGKYTPDGRAFDIGNTTSLALVKYKKNKTTFKCGLNDVNTNGNGSLMRILPISLYLYYMGDEKWDIINDISSMTHAHIYSILSCYIYSLLVNEYMIELDIKKAYSNMQLKMKELLENDANRTLGDLDDLKSKFYRIIYNDIATFNEDDIKSSGYVIDSLEACLWCLFNSQNYKEAVLKAVNLGSDTDTIAALTGGLAGLVYGYEDIPKKWLEVLRQKEYLTDLVYKFVNLLNDVRYHNFFSVQSDANNLNGEDASLNIKATSACWECFPFSTCKRIDCNIILSPEEFKIISMGHIPDGMDDHWFMYCDNTAIKYFRSWTGIQIFKGYYRFENNSYIIYALEINDNEKEYSEKDTNKSLDLFKELITSTCERHN